MIWSLIARTLAVSASALKLHPNGNKEWCFTGNTPGFSASLSAVQRLTADSMGESTLSVNWDTVWRSINLQPYPMHLYVVPEVCRPHDADGPQGDDQRKIWTPATPRSGTGSLFLLLLLQSTEDAVSTVASPAQRKQGLWELM